MEDSMMERKLQPALTLSLPSLGSIESSVVDRVTKRLVQSGAWESTSSEIRVRNEDEDTDVSRTLDGKGLVVRSGGDESVTRWKLTSLAAKTCR